MISGNAEASGLGAAIIIIIFEFIGGILAGVVFQKVYKPTYVKWKKRMMEE
mgnify:CR=1 FL=1